MLKRYLKQFLDDKYDQENLIFQIFRSNFTDIINSEEKYGATLIVESQLNNLLNGKELENVGEISTDFESVQDQISRNNIYLSKIHLKGIKGIINVQDKCKNKDENCSDGVLVNLEGRKSAIIFGWNGEGKSSILEGMEYCLTGDVVEAKRRGTKGNIKDYILNSDSKVGIARVELFQPFNPPRKVLLERKTDESSGKVSLDNCEEHNLFHHMKDNLEAYEEYFSKHFIEKNRIEDFVLSKGAENRQRYGQLIGLDELNNFIKNSWRSYNTEKKQGMFQQDNNINKELEKANTQLEQLKGILSSELSTVELTSEEEEIILGLLGIDKKELKDKITILVQDNFTNILNEKIIEHKNKQEETKGLLEVKENIDTYSKAKEQYTLMIDENSDKDQIVVLLKFYETALSVIEEHGKDECPLCGSDKLYGKDLIEQVTESYNKLENVKETLEKKEKLKHDLEKYKNIIHANIIRYFEEYRNQNLFETDLEIGAIKTKIENEIKELSFNVEKNIDELTKLRTKLSVYKQKYSEHMRKKKETEENLRELSRKLKDLKDEQVKEQQINNLKVKMLEDIKEFEKRLNDYYLETLGDKLNSICNKIQQYYNLFEENYPFYKIELIPSKNEINFSVEFQQGKKVDPLKVLSEGQLRCFGLAILLANSDNIGTNFIILDDIVNAIDIEHRSQIVKALKNLIESGRQVILTTHDKLFREKLINSLSSTKKIITYSFTTKGIIRQDTSEVDFIEKINKFIERKDCRSALVYMRILLENTLYSMADGNVSLVFKDSIYKYKLSDVFEGVSQGDRRVKKVKDYFMSNNKMNWSLLNQENHFWSEQSLCLDCNIMKELSEKVISLKIIQEFNSLDERDKVELQNQKSLEMPIIENFEEGSKVFAKGFIEEGNWGYTYNILKELI